MQIQSEFLLADEEKKKSDTKKKVCASFLHFTNQTSNQFLNFFFSFLFFLFFFLFIHVHNFLVSCLKSAFNLSFIRWCSLICIRRKTSRYYLFLFPPHSPTQSARRYSSLFHSSFMLSTVSTLEKIPFTIWTSSNGVRDTLIVVEVVLYVFQEKCGVKKSKNFSVDPFFLSFSLLSFFSPYSR